MRSIRRKQTHNHTKKRKPAEHNIKQIIKRLLQSLLIVKLYHWNTHVYSVHKATDKLYDDLNNHTDRFVEVLLGKHDNLHKHHVLDVGSIQMKIFRKNTDFIKWLDELKKYLIYIDNIFNQPEDSDILSIRDEILVDLNKITYLLSLR